MNRRLLWGVVWLVGGLGGGCSGTEAPRLEEGDSWRLEVVDGEEHTFVCELAAGELLRLRADQRGVDIEQSLTRGGETLAFVDSNSGRQGPETLLFEAQASGRYVVQVRAIGGEGDVKLDVLELGAGSAVSRSMLGVRRLLDRQDGDRKRVAEELQALTDEVPAIERARYWWRFGRTLLAAGRLEEAAEVFNKARVLFVGLRGGEWELATLLNDLSATYLNLGQLGEADTILDRALEHAERIGYDRTLAVALSNRGLWHTYRGELAKAIEAYTHSRDLAQELDGGGGILATTEHNIAVNELLLGRLDAGLEMLQTIETRLVGEDADHREKLGFNFSVQAWALDHLNRDTEAEALYGRAVELIGVSGGQELAELLEQRAEFYLDTGRPELALADLETSRAQASPDPVHEAYLDLRFGAAFAATHQLERAMRSLERAGASFENLSLQHGRLATYVELARTFRRLDRPEAARFELEGAIQLTENLRAELSVPTFRRSFLAAKHEVYVELVDLLASQGEAAAAFEVAEAGRARSLLDALDDPESSGEELISSMRVFSERRFAALQAGDMASAEALADRIRHNRRELERRQEARLSASKKSTLPSQRATPSPCTLREIQTHLDEGTVLLSFLLGDERSWLFRVDATSILAIERPPRGEIERSAQTLHELLEENLDADDAGVSGSTALAEAALRRLAVLLFEGVNLGHDRLAIVSDGALHLVPFGALPTDGGQTGKEQILLESHELIFLPSSSVLVSLRERIARREPPGQLLAIVADPVYSLSDERLEEGSRSQSLAWRFRRLPASALEARRLAALAQDHSPLVRLGFEAQAELVLGETLQSYRWLHFASHAFLDPRYPQQSGLVLSLVDENGGSLDGLLRPQDLSHLELGAELVVLSACETALGERLQGEGVVGLAQAFFSGGASRLVASLWEVQDNELTVGLMEGFYGALLAGRPPAAALREAQLEQYRRGVPTNQWAAFVFIGPWDPLAPLP